jgi:hypothetical protein
MIRVTVGGQSYGVTFRYSRIQVQTGVEIPKDTYAVLYAADDTTVVSKGTALLHHADHGKFRKKLGRKIALADAVRAIEWSKAEKKEFWDQMMPWVRD